MAGGNGQMNMKGMGLREQSELPGSPKAVEESLTYILDSLEHGMDILLGRDGECARR